MCHFWPNKIMTFILKKSTFYKKVFLQNELHPHPLVRPWWQLLDLEKTSFVAWQAEDRASASTKTIFIVAIIIQRRHENMFISIMWIQHKCSVTDTQNLSLTLSFCLKMRVWLQKSFAFLGLGGKKQKQNTFQHFWSLGEKKQPKYLFWTFWSLVLECSLGTHLIRV